MDAVEWGVGDTWGRSRRGRGERLSGLMGWEATMALLQVIWLAKGASEKRDGREGTRSVVVVVVWGVPESPGCRRAQVRLVHGGGAEAQRPLLIPARVSVMRDRKAPWAMGFDCLALARCLINDWALAVAVTIAVLNSLLFASQSVRSRLV